MLKGSTYHNNNNNIYIFNQYTQEETLEACVGRNLATVKSNSCNHLLLFRTKIYSPGPDLTITVNLQ